MRRDVVLASLLGLLAHCLPSTGQEESVSCSASTATYETQFRDDLQQFGVQATIGPPDHPIETPGGALDDNDDDDGYDRKLYDSQAEKVEAVKLAAVPKTKPKPAAAEVKKSLVLDPSSNFGKWEGWGTSLSWWAKAFGDRDDLANLFFSKNTQKINGKSLPGLGLNIARYNAGASSDKGYHGYTMQRSPNARQSRLIDGYWLNWQSRNPASSSWDWTVDANQRSMLKKAKAAGANTFELFSVSPMWWMTYSHNPSGSVPAGLTDNLQSWNYDAHAIYLSSIAQHARDNWGIDFHSIEPFNEPSTHWQGDKGKQEGCYFEYGTMGKVLAELKEKMKNRGLTSLITGVDANKYDVAIATWQNLDGSSRQTIEKINVHGYQYTAGDRNALYSIAKKNGKVLWQSEYGDNDATGKQMCTCILLDFAKLHPTAWVQWQAVDGKSWGLLFGDHEKKKLGDANMKYFVLAQFSRHVRQGMRILAAPDDNTMAAYDASAKKLVIVAANWDVARTLVFDLSKFSAAGTDGSVVPRWSTQPEGGDQYVAYKDLKLTKDKLVAKFSADQIQTFEIEGVKL
ncbi:Endo-beta-1,6-galactanase [Drechmeria coniospora]|uniref:Endo-beta-1,6-galactanase n=1 Tax=Drechmeria coniospora TaxID=98403 RepID=A0A151GLX4_DRECN|nr:Endo-beta-1,6-galactanase [Drechmeria coniospora]KYK58096.1 Endo-beta-1,6-galactanase [Drechmeria coniospora]